jgi:hypothetical protein
VIWNLFLQKWKPLELRRGETTNLLSLKQSVFDQIVVFGGADDKASILLHMVRCTVCF